ncbi:MAG: xanthine dehydrogenase small subunit, partial [Alphaproteobacteria bacterium]
MVGADTNSDAIRFVVGGVLRELRGVDPNTTALDWLRESERKTGTKEGCAEGDCGACTVVLGELAGSRIRYRALNACLLFVPALDGKELVVVEDMRAPDGKLHPVQQALVDHHGSQCGFCTPGFVMSLFALYKAETKPRRASINDAVAGNLCRCTGYRPIIDAGLAMGKPGADDQFAAREKQTARLLRSIRRKETFGYQANGHRYFAPTCEDELAALYRKYPKAHLLAGGTDLGLLVTKQHRDLDTLIALGGVAGMRYAKRQGGSIEIGAATPYSEASGIIGKAYADFGELFRRLGSVQIRNAGTIGGNIANASPIGDSMPGLIALGASLRLRRGRSVRQVPLDEFYTGYRQTVLQPSEFISGIRLPAPRRDRHFHTYKIGKRFDQDISAVCGAFAITLVGGRIGEARVCYGGMASTPQ